MEMSTNFTEHEVPLSPHPKATGSSIPRVHGPAVRIEKDDSDPCLKSGVVPSAAPAALVPRSSHGHSSSRSQFEVSLEKAGSGFSGGEDQISGFF